MLFFKISKRAQNNLNVIVGWLFIGYISLCSVTTLPIFSIPQIQISEIFFILLLPLSFIYFKNRKCTSIDKLLFIYVSLFLINAIYHWNLTSTFETFGSIYLVLMSIILSRFLAYENNFNSYIKKSMLGLFGVTTITGVLGLLLHFLNIDHSFGSIYNDFPYLGDVWRLHGLSWSNLLLSCIALSSFYLILIDKKYTITFFIVLVSIIVTVFTLSKEIIIYSILMILGIYLKKHFISKKIILGLVSILSIFMVWFTFFVFAPKGQSLEISKIGNPTQIVPIAVFNIGNYEFYGTTYFYMAKASLIFISQNPIWGIGSGQFSSQLQKAKSSGDYPSDLSVYDTHDFYWGQIAELGFLYVVFLGLLLVELYHLLNNRLQLEMKNFLFISLTFSYFLIAYLVGGSKHYRHFWIFIGIVNYFYLSYYYPIRTTNVTPST